MSDAPKNGKADHGLPRAEIKHRGWRFPVVWLVPLVVAIVAVYVAYDRSREFGPKITITFNDSSGVVTGQTPIKYRGVPVGEVTAVRLSKDLRHAEVRARLQRSAAPIARDGSIFWIVRPEVGLGNITGLQTVLTGPEIQVLPGSGVPKSEFVGLESPPQDFEGKGLRIVLRTSHLGFLKKNSPVYYRGMEVGVVQDTQLSNNATAVDVHAVIEQRYAPLVRSGSVFWDVSGVDVSGGLFRGLDIKVESLRTLVAGGVAFATPDDPQGARARDGAVFPLYAESKPEWLEWAPQISMPIQK
jgi:paraquat-inducible protein B